MNFFKPLRNDKIQILIKYSLMILVLQAVYLILSLLIPQMEQTGYIISIDRILISVLTIIAEEFLFRYLIIGRIGKYSIVSLITSSILFALMHIDIITLVLYFIAGMMIGKLYIDTKDIRYPITLHMLNNVLAVIITVF